jgi:glycosyltransferase involved in cell wall biosynthesis
MPHRVLHVITTVDPGGAENHLLTLAVAQARAGHAVDLAYLRGEGRREGALAAAGVRPIRLGRARRPSPGALLRLASLIRSARYSVVHAHLIEGELAAALALTLAPGPRLVITRHNDDPFWRRRVVRRLANWLAGRADRVIGISDHVGRSFADLGVPVEKLTTIHYGLEPAEAGRARAELGIPHDGPLLGAVGRLVEQKGHDVLLRALAELPGARLAIVGEGPAEADLRARAASLGDRVHWLGWRPDGAECMAAFDVFVHPSRWEGLGLVLLEAMALARPIVASRVSAIPEIVVDGETGWLVPPDDPAALAGALRAAIDDPAEARRRGLAGRRRLDACFTVARMTAATTAVYDRAVAGSRGASPLRETPRG